jgi:tetrahedral aminopeptidase
MDLFKHLQTLTETPAPSGFEHKIAPVIQELWEPYVDTITIDRVGSLVAAKHGQGDEPRPRILLAAHMDEIGLMVADIVDHNGQGFLRVTNLGGVDIRQLYAQLVTVHGKKNLSGVMGSLPPHLLPENRRDKPFGYEELVVDLGLPIDMVKEQVSIGNAVSFRQPLRKLLGKRVAGKSLDNRASVAAVSVCLEYLNGRSHLWDVVAVATAQEETRLLGAFTATYSQRPDAAIAIDVTFGTGPGANDERAFDLGSGPVIEIGPNVHPGMTSGLTDTADKLEMKHNIGTHSRYSGTDAFGLQIARDGVPTGLVSIPLRYMHTMVESIDTKDVERVGKLLGEFIANLDYNFVDTLSKSQSNSQIGKTD